ncbi:hypothetical protein [Shewanella cyperi]|uniref:hypothetical protein n=1 Tax=Shewanella cyperi TaxID=2814292 RepID=UPI001A93D328|nr:hypothetical protein [Shewanella cyperi]QSX39855.1 hypothetical protein JYB84_12700 [Shewanella cyperi]
MTLVRPASKYQEARQLLNEPMNIGSLRRYRELAADRQHPEAAAIASLNQAFRDAVSGDEELFFMALEQGLL